MLQAVGHNILLKKIKSEEKKIGKTAIILTNQPENPIYEVVSVGENVKCVSSGNKIYCQYPTTIHDGSEEYHLCKDDLVLAKIL